MKKGLNWIILLLILGIAFILVYMFIINSNIKEIKLDKEVISLHEGETDIIIASIFPGNARDKTIVWKSLNENIAVVDNNGVVTAVNIGETDIVAESKNGSVRATCHVKVLIIEVEKIELSSESIKLEIGEKTKIGAKIFPNNATYKEIVYKSSDESIVLVDNNGNIEAKKAGKVEITVTDLRGKVESKCIVEVVNPITSISLNKTSLSLDIGQKESLKATISPSNASNKELIWKSSDESIVIVEKGTLIAKKVGKATITVTDITGNVKAKCQVEVLAPVSSISINPMALTMELGEVKTLGVTISPANASNKSVTWSSSNNNIATVNNGKVTPKKTGTVTITAKSSNGKTATSIITIVNNTYKKTAIFFGDSITMGKDGHYSWANYIGEKYDLSGTTNAGISGGVISDTREGYWIEDVVRKYKVKSYNYVIMHGGINDISKKTAMGSYNPNDFSGNYNTKTFIGGLEHYIYTVKKQWPNAKIGYIVNYATPLASSVASHQELYYSKLKEVLNKWKVSYIDLYAGRNPSGVKYSDLLKVNTKTYLGDGVHLTREGYYLISPYIYNWMNSL